MPERPSPEIETRERSPRLRRTRELTNEILETIQSGQTVTLDTFHGSIDSQLSLQEGLQASYSRLSNAYMTITGETLDGIPIRLDKELYNNKADMGNSEQRLIEEVDELVAWVDIFTGTASRVRSSSIPTAALTTASHIHEIGEMLEQPSLLANPPEFEDDYLCFMQSPEQVTEDTLPPAYYEVINRLSLAHDQRHAEFAETHIDPSVLRACHAGVQLESSPGTLGHRAIIDIFLVIEEECAHLCSKVEEEYGTGSEEHYSIIRDVTQLHAETVSALPPKPNLSQHLAKDSDIHRLNQYVRGTIAGIDNPELIPDADMVLITRNGNYRNSVRLAVLTYAAARQEMSEQEAITFLFKHTREMGKITERVFDNIPGERITFTATEDEKGRQTRRVYTDNHSSSQLLAG